MDKTAANETGVAEFTRQLSLFGASGQVVDTERIVNVASVPKRSPFRYPGGKTWLVPYIRKWLTSLPERPAVFIEPFAGGGSVSLTVAAEELAQQVIMVELDTQVAAVWQTLLQDEGGGEWLAERIVSFDLTAEQVAAVLSEPEETLSRRERAFQTILKNRVNRGGILAAGAGMVKLGEEGRGLKSRWYPATLARRIRAIVALRGRISFIQGDGLAVSRAYAPCLNTAFFLDPPYTAAGKRAGMRLYTLTELNHPELFQIVATLRGDFLMTYENAEELQWLARSHQLATQQIAMKNTHHAAMKELLIGRDLAWLS